VGEGGERRKKKEGKIESKTIILKFSNFNQLLSVIK
jgi:hypothetical protein